MKKRGIVIFLILSLVLSFLGVAFAWCVDSDGGEDYFKKGYAKDDRGGRGEDACREILSGNEKGGRYVYKCKGEGCYLEEAICEEFEPGKKLVGLFAPEGKGIKCHYGCKDGACLKEEIPLWMWYYDAPRLEHVYYPLLQMYKIDYEKKEILIQLNLTYSEDNTSALPEHGIRIVYDVLANFEEKSKNITMPKFGDVTVWYVVGDKLISNVLMAYNNEKKVYEARIPFALLSSSERFAFSYKVEFIEPSPFVNLSEEERFEHNHDNYIIFQLSPICQLNSKNLECESVGYPPSVKYARDYKTLSLTIKNNMSRDISGLHIDIEGCDSFDYTKTLKSGEFFFTTTRTTQINCSIFEKVNYKKIRITYEDKDGTHVVDGWIFFMLPEALYMNNCSYIPAEKIMPQTNCAERFRGGELKEGEVCLSLEENMLYYGGSDIGGKPYFGTGGILYKDVYGNWQFLENICKSIKEIKVLKCAESEEDIFNSREVGDTILCEGNTICEKGRCVDAGVCPAKIKFEASGSIITRDKFPGLFIRTYDNKGNLIESLIIVEDYFNSEKLGESIMRIPKEGLEIRDLEKKKFEPGSYKLVLKSPVVGCKTEKVIEFTMKEEMTTLDRFLEFFRRVF